MMLYAVVVCYTQNPCDIPFSTLVSNFNNIFFKPAFVLGWTINEFPAFANTRTLSTSKTNSIMSTITAYFIPAKKFPLGQFTEKVKDTLEKLNLIDGYYDEEDNTYAHGRAIIFEYATIHDTDKNKLVPEASSTGYGAICIQCNAEVDEELYDVINNYYDYEGESGKEKDMAGLTLTCNNCNKSMKLQDVKFTLPVMLTNHFFQFVDIDDEISEDVLKKIEQNLDTELRVIYERM